MINYIKNTAYLIVFNFIFFSFLVAQEAGSSTPVPSSETSVTEENAEENGEIEPIAVPTDQDFEIFVPSQEISEDQSVDFPADI